MIEHRYSLEPYKTMKSRHRCPVCEKDKTFALYIDTETGEALSPGVVRCNRESSCGYHFKPKEYFEQNGISFNMPQLRQYIQPKPHQKPISCIPVDLFKGSLQGYHTNHFTSYLNSLFGNDITNQLISRYFIGSSKHWNGATVFWQIDSRGKVRTGKIMLYSPATGKRVKEPQSYITWVHTAIKQPDFELKQCLFGEHLLKSNTKPVAIVESEKTAIIASVYLPGFIWVAVGSLSNLNADKCSLLAGRTVCLFPDLNGFDKWKAKAQVLSQIANFKISDLLEQKATEAEKKQGLDLADYLIRFDYKAFNKVPENLTKPDISKIYFIEREQAQAIVKPQPEPGINLQSPTKMLANVNLLPHQQAIEQSKPVILWDLNFNFESIPKTPILLSPGEVITNPAKFIESHLTTCQRNNGNRTYLPYFERLKALAAMRLTAG